jgi:TPR repeat protein
MGFAFIARRALCSCIGKTKALAFYRRASELGNRAAKCDLGVILLNGENGVQDEDEAVSLITQAALAGHAISQFNLGIEHNALRAIKAKPISVSTSDMEIL